MQLKRVEVIGDDEAEIGEATRRMSENYDFVVTRQVPPLQSHSTLRDPSGGIQGHGKASMVIC